MILTQNQLLEVIDVQDFSGIPGINRYFYWTSQDPSSETDFTTFATNFENTVVSDLRNLQSTTCDHTEIIVRPRVGVVIETVKSLSGVSGGLATPNRASMESTKFTLQRTNNTTRVGHKRFYGLTEAMVDGNFLHASFNALMDTLAVTLLQPISQGAFTWQPVIARQLNPVTDDWAINIISGVSWDNLITSQLSRKQVR